MILPNELKRAAKIAKHRAKKRAKRAKRAAKQRIAFVKGDTTVHFPREPFSAECTDAGRLSLAQYGYRPFSNKEYVGAHNKPQSRKARTTHEREQFRENRKK